MKTRKLFGLAATGAILVGLTAGGVEAATPPSAPPGLPLVTAASPLDASATEPGSTRRPTRQIGWEGGSRAPSPHTTGRTVPYHGGLTRRCSPEHRLPVYFLDQYYQSELAEGGGGQGCVHVRRAGVPPPGRGH